MRYQYFFFIHTCNQGNQLVGRFQNLCKTTQGNCIQDFSINFTELSKSFESQVSNKFCLYRKLPKSFESQDSNKSTVSRLFLTRIEPIFQFCFNKKPSNVLKISFTNSHEFCLKIQFSSFSTKFTELAQKCLT